MEGVCEWGYNWQHGWKIISNKCENLRHLDYTNFLLKMSIGSKTKLCDCYPWNFYLMHMANRMKANKLLDDEHN